MSDSKPLIHVKRNFAEEIESLKKEGATNTFVEKLINDTEKKTKAEMEEQANSKFWTGFLIGLISALVIVFFWKVR
jgi:aspartyl aminopeptidase